MASYKMAIYKIAIVRKPENGHCYEMAMLQNGLDLKIVQSSCLILLKFAAE